MRVVVAVVALAGCDRVFAIFDLPASPDATSSDTPIAPQDGIRCFGMYGSGAPAGLFQYCTSNPLPGLSPSSAITIDTDHDLICDVVAQVDNTQVCAISGEQVVISGSVTVTGSRPLVIVAAQNLTVAGTGSIDVAAHTDYPSLAAAPVVC